MRRAASDARIDITSPQQAGGTSRWVRMPRSLSQNQTKAAGLRLSYLMADVP